MSPPHQALGLSLGPDQQALLLQRRRARQGAMARSGLAEKEGGMAGGTSTSFSGASLGSQHLGELSIASSTLSLPLDSEGRNDQRDRRGRVCRRETLSPSLTIRNKRYQYPGLAVIAHHRLRSLKQIYSLAVLETRSSKSRHQLTHVPLRALGKSTFMANPSSADSRLPLGFWPHHSGSASIPSWLSPLCLCTTHVPLPGSYKDPHHWI